MIACIHVSKQATKCSVTCLLVLQYNMPRLTAVRMVQPWPLRSFLFSEQDSKCCRVKDWSGSDWNDWYTLIINLWTKEKPTPAMCTAACVSRRNPGLLLSKQHLVESWPVRNELLDKHREIKIDVKTPNFARATTNQAGPTQKQSLISLCMCWHATPDNMLPRNLCDCLQADTAVHALTWSHATHTSSNQSRLLT